MTASAPTLSHPRPDEVVEVELTTQAMGGGLTLRVTSTLQSAERAERDLRRVAARIGVWANRLSRYEHASDLSRLNVEPTAARVSLRPTLAAVLRHAQEMRARTEGTVDVAMLDERLAAELDSWSVPLTRGSWNLEGRGRTRVLIRCGHSRFDLDGVAKGWIADRALRLLDDHQGALVDADGDMAIRTPTGAGWLVTVDHPTQHHDVLATLHLPDKRPGSRMGIATSGTSVHRWGRATGYRHHLIDPLTSRPARTDVVQATVAAESAATAECLAKSAVIRGSIDGLALLQRAGAWAAILLLENGDVVATPRTSGWLA